MRAPVILELDPIADCAACMRQTFEAMTMDALLLQRSYQALHHPVLLRAVWRDELLLEAVATHQLGVCTGREDQTVVTAQKKRLIDFAQSSETSD